MILNNKKYLALIVLIVFSFSCKTKKQTKAEPPVKEKKEQVVIPISELYGHACGVCHDLPAPSDHDSTEWHGILKSMQKRAHLSDKNIEDIYQYILEEKGSSEESE